MLVTTGVQDALANHLSALLLTPHLVCSEKVSLSMSTSTRLFPLARGQSSSPVVHIAYECIVQRRLQESESYIYELACSITYPVSSGYLCLRVTGKNTFQNKLAREVAFIRHEIGATTYVELLEGEQLEVRIVEHEGSYGKACYYAHGQELIELHARRIASSIQRLATPADMNQNGKLS